jgi:hypothetical protein|uniref:Uncharacterized protein n=1 Tax=Siphoviridae sp. ctMYJ33 TaxID=2825461 RepID=A0A8S5PBD3_9CAUD|nr:MAG TPA: hypothetical protein [Siphoviridae sp. ctMYJ33]
MKITIYELLGLVKDGKAPKKIAYNSVILEYAEGNEDYYSYYGRGLFEYKFTTCNDFLNDEVEIIEEPKKIEYEQIEELTCNEYDFEKKTINSLIKNQRKLIDEVNKLKEGK